MKSRRLSSTITTALMAMAFLLFASPVFADKIGVTVEGNEELSKKITEALKEEGHEMIDIAELVKDVKLDAATAAEIGKKSEAELIVSLRKVGPTMILKVLSTKNDTVQGGVPKAEEGTIGMIKDLIKKVKDSSTS